MGVVSTALNIRKYAPGAIPLPPKNEMLKLVVSCYKSFILIGLVFVSHLTCLMLSGSLWYHGLHKGKVRCSAVCHTTD